MHSSSTNTSIPTLFQPATTSFFWLDQLSDGLLPEQGVADDDLTTLKVASVDLQAKTVNASLAAAQATAAKSDSRQQAESLVRAEKRCINTRSNYTAASSLRRGVKAFARAVLSNARAPI